MVDIAKQVAEARQAYTEAIQYMHDYDGTEYPSPAAKAYIAALEKALEERDGMLREAYVHDYDSMRKLRMGYEAWAGELRLLAARKEGD